MALCANSCYPNPPNLTHDLASKPTHCTPKLAEECWKFEVAGSKWKKAVLGFVWGDRWGPKVVQRGILSLFWGWGSLYIALRWIL